MTILCVDDDPDDLDLFREAVSSINPQATCLLAKDAESALQFLQNAVILPDYVFLDINMPGMDGLRFLQLLHSMKEFENLPVVMYSTSIDHQQYLDSIKNGAIGFIRKANTLKEMYNSLRMFVK